MRLDHLLSTEIQGAVRARCRPPAGWSGVGGAAGVEEIGGSRVVRACFWVPGPPPGLRVRRWSAIPGPVRPPGGVRGFGFRSWWWFENWRVDASKKDFLFLFTVFSDELLLVEVLFFVLIVL